MKPIDQTRMGWPHGNCYAACVASILEIDITECPVVDASKGEYWNRIWDNWLSNRGLTRVTVRASESEWRPEGFWIACGPSPRDLVDGNTGKRAHHAVVALGEHLIHDPHPERRFLAELYEIDIIYPLDLGRWTRQPRA